MKRRPLSKSYIDAKNLEKEVSHSSVYVLVRKVTDKRTQEKDTICWPKSIPVTKK